MPAPSVTYTFSNSTTADATQVNQNFTDLINGASDGTKDYSINALTVAGAATFNGNITFGNASGDDVTFTGSLASTIPIKTTFSYDLGSSTKGVKDIYWGSADSAAFTTKIRAATVGANNTITLPTQTGTMAIEAAVPLLCEGRLTLTSGTPVTTSDVTAATTIYFTPYLGNRIALYTGSAWEWFTFTEISISVPATTVTMYDVFVYNNSGTLTLELTSWTNDTTRATAITFQNGVYVKSGATTRRYLGSFRTTGSSGQTEDSAGKRYLWNYYNRVTRQLKGGTETTDSWTYSTASWRQANGALNNLLDVVIGVSEDQVVAQANSLVSNSTSSTRSARTGIGVDSTSANSAQMTGFAFCTNAVLPNCMATYRGYPGIGRHYLAWLEYGAGSDTQTWFGDNGDATTMQMGITGELRG